MALSLEDLNNILANEIAELDEKSRRWWDLMRIEPEQWVLTDSSYEKYKKNLCFWVVGIMGNRALWFLDREGDWSLSPFSTYGYIDAYLGNGGTDYCDPYSIINRLTAFVDGDDVYRGWLHLP